eukprot:1614021-Rhodomonas_salina.4
MSGADTGLGLAGGGGEVQGGVGGGAEGVGGRGRGREGSRRGVRAGHADHPGTVACVGSRARATADVLWA